MKFLNLFMFSILIIMTMACRTATVTVLEDDDQNFRLADYSTFNFYEATPEGIFDQEQQNYISLIKNEVSLQLTERGLARDAENPDLMINIGISTEERVQTRETGLVTDPGTFQYIGQRRYVWRSETIETGRYQVGTGTIHLIDREEDRAVWVGVVEKILRPRLRDYENAIRKGVEKVFERIDEYQ